MTEKPSEAYLAGYYLAGIKECQGDLFADRTPAATMRANQITPQGLAILLTIIISLTLWFLLRPKPLIRAETQNHGS